MPGPVTTPVVEEDEIRSVTSAGVRDGSPESKSAAAPATWGEAIEVPDQEAVEVVEVMVEERIPEPGAKMSRQVPKFEKEERESVEVVAPTVIAAGAEAGDAEQASELSLPAATATVTPSLTARWIAAFMVEE